jgi:RNA polymerase sigma-70 factor (ECF subfamily)
LDQHDEPRGVAALREHGAALARVCMALLGEATAAESALERVAREVATTRLPEGKDVLARLMGLAREACAVQLSKLPIRGTVAPGASAPDAPPATTRDQVREPTLARAALGRLKPTEREAVVLHLVGGLDTAQVAEACGTDIATARGRIARGVAQLVEEEKHR